MVNGFNDDLYTQSSPQITQYPSQGSNTVLILVWLVSGLFTVLIPLIFRTLKQNNYRNMYAMYNWEEAQQQYEEAQQQYQQNMEEYYQNQYYANNGQQGGGNNYQYQWEQMTGNYDVNHCQWYQLNCYPYYINEQGEPVPQAGWYPMWFSGWTQTEDEREQMLEDGDTSSALRFAYLWQMVMFFVILLYGYYVIRQNRVVTGLTLALVIFLNMAFLSMWMLADGSIVTDGETVRQYGFYGQFPVLMFMTNFWYIVFGLIFTVVLVLRGRYMHATTTTTTTIDGATHHKHAPQRPPVAAAVADEEDEDDTYQQLPAESPPISPTVNRAPVRWDPPSPGYTMKQKQERI